ncbi:hypothetical protein P153DRAFT_368853 [Dothidotthia symphoricarpi CBS 119687]|uniref:F-box domain-containing protein n=1 Tax=Dothidotthia symphoricarpi CBS 119687 TaxID=1392245 RepID=A0A6A6A5I9_9PLEO|nr:uncharacterized protein P153DRAFT_368853 [Dothidotthia symphoricarpi CBS 119687]KAF2126806.1 hypothetical protein P153DRAFT_368853 [Dothidotthia symphoricarpi CBS 119687]
MSKRKFTKPGDLLPGPSPRKRRAQGTDRPFTTKTSVLNDLPEELILEVLDQVLWWEDGDAKAHYQTLHSLSLTNRKLYRLTKSYLYTIVDNVFVDSGKLLRSAIQEPELAKRIKCVHWLDDHQGSPYQWNPDNKYKLSQIERRELCKLVDRLGIPEIQAYRIGFKEQKMRDNLTSLLLVAPDIESIEVADTNMCCSPSGYRLRPMWLKLLCDAGMSTIPGLSTHFQHLSTIRLQMGPIKLEHIGGMLRLPSLRALMLEDIFHPGEILPWRWDAEVAPRCSNLQVLYIENSYIDSLAVAQILHAIKALKLFCLDFDNWIHSAANRFFGERPPLMHYPTLAAALLAHKDSLEQLSLEDSSEGELRAFFGDETGCLGSLRDMHKLKYVDMGLYPFRQNKTPHDDNAAPARLAENLPRNIEHMDISIEEVLNDAEEKRWRRDLEDLARTCKTMVPLLREIRVAKRLVQVVFVDDEVRKIKEKFAEQGVVLRFCGEEGYRPTVKHCTGGGRERDEDVDVDVDDAEVDDDDNDSSLSIQLMADLLGTAGGTYVHGHEV